MKGTDVQTNNHNEVQFVLRYTVERAEGLCLRQVQEYFREVVS